MHQKLQSVQYNKPLTNSDLRARSTPPPLVAASGHAGERKETPPADSQRMPARSEPAILRAVVSVVLPHAANRIVSDVALAASAEVDELAAALAGEAGPAVATVADSAEVERAGQIQRPEFGVTKAGTTASTGKSSGTATALGLVWPLTLV